MGNSIKSLVFRPPIPTPLRRNRYFWLKIDEKDNQIPAFFINRKNARVTLLYSHGNAEDLGMMYSRMRELARVLCVNILAYDYCGYGMSTGEANEANCFRCISAAYKYLLENRKLEPKDIVLYGRSVGSGPTCYLAAKLSEEGKPVGGVILHSPFLSIFRIALDIKMSMYGDMFKNIEFAPKIKSPVFIIHGTSDEIVPFWHAPELMRNISPQFRTRPYYAKGFGHNNIETKNKEVYVSRITDFLLANLEAMHRQGHNLVKHKSILSHSVNDKSYVNDSHPREWINPTWVKNWHIILEEACACQKIQRSVYDDNYYYDNIDDYEQAQLNVIAEEKCDKNKYEDEMGPAIEISTDVICSFSEADFNIEEKFEEYEILPILNKTIISDHKLGQILKKDQKEGPPGHRPCKDQMTNEVNET